MSNLYPRRGYITYDTEVASSEKIDILMELLRSNMLTINQVKNILNVQIESNNHEYETEENWSDVF